MSKVVVVTGASRGIGLATVKELVSRNYSVVACSTDLAALKKALDGVENVFCVQADVSNPREVEKLFSLGLKEFGSIDFLVNNAGVGFARPLRDTEIEDLDEVIDVNVKGVLYCCKQAEKVIQKGAIINISSVYGVTASANVSVYAASKFAVIGLSKALAVELDPKIKVFVVCPGAVATTMLRNDFGFTGDAVSPEKIAGIISNLIEKFEETDSGKIIEVWKI
ncbi:MAG: SDR family oxidoreductase [Candidatus Micrarchaeota archaeon]